MMPDSAYWEGRVPCIVDPRSTSFKVWEFPDRLLLADHQCFEAIPFNQGVEAIPVVQDRELIFEIHPSETGGTMEGLAIHIEIELDGVGNRLTSRCTGSHWANIFVMLNEEIAMGAGDRVHVRTVSDMDRPTPEYTFVVEVERGGERGTPIRVTTH